MKFSDPLKKDKNLTAKPLGGNMQKQGNQNNGNGEVAVVARQAPQMLISQDPIRSVEVALDKIDAMKAIARTLLKSGFLPYHINTEEKAVTIMLKGLELGVPMMTSLENIAVIKGKPVIQGNLMLSLIRRTGGTWKVLEQTNTACRIEFQRPGFEPYTAAFTIEDAKRAGLLNKKGEIWQMYTRLMLFWRAVAIGGRTLFPDAVQGLYIPEELAEVRLTEEGEFEIIDEPSPKTPQAQARAAVTKTEPEPSSQKTAAPVPAAGEAQTLEEKVNGILNQPDENGHTETVSQAIKEKFETEAPADEKQRSDFKKQMQGLKKKLEEKAGKQKTDEFWHDLLTKYQCNALDDFQYRTDMVRVWTTANNALELVEVGQDLSKKPASKSRGKKKKR
jgi:hypothetical protein